jgi:hypothetical protein
MSCRNLPARLRYVILAVTPILAAAMLCSGCASKSDHSKFAKWDVRRAVGMKPKKPEPEIPTRLVATWSDATLNTPGEASKRGFGGRLIFFKDETQDPVRVEGQLVVYAYDESAQATPGAAPTRRYIVMPEQLAKQEGDSTLGPYYSVWLPWDDVGGPQKKISLITRFEPKGGPIVLGEQTQHLLPGVEPATETLIAAAQIKPIPAPTPTANSSSGVELAAFSGQEQPAKAKPTITTATIDLPPRIGEAMQSLPNDGTPRSLRSPLRNTTVRTSTLPVEEPFAKAAPPPAVAATATLPQAAPPSAGFVPVPPQVPMTQVALPERARGPNSRSLGGLRSAQ